MANTKQAELGRNQGFFRVMEGRALHWPNSDGKPRIWARAGQHVDIRSPFLADIVRQTRQHHKLIRVDAVPADAVCVTVADIPSEIRDRLKQYEAGNPTVHKAGDEIEAKEEARSIDLDQLPSAAAPAQKTPQEAPKAASPEKAPEKPRTGRKAKDD